MLRLSIFAIAATIATQSMAFGAELQSASALAFGQAGVLFVGDSLAGAVIAIDTGDDAPNAVSGEIDIASLDGEESCGACSVPTPATF